MGCVNHLVPVDTAITQYQSSFETTQAQRQQSFDATQAQRQQTFDAQLAAYRAEIAEIAQSFRTSASPVVDSGKLEMADGLKALDLAVAQTKEAALTKAKEVEPSIESSPKA